MYSICASCYVFEKKVDSANRQGILLEMVQVMTDLELVISKSYISSDGGWFMDGEFKKVKFLSLTIIYTVALFCGSILSTMAVFHVTDQRGNKITDESLINYIQQVSFNLFVQIHYIYSQLLICWCS